MKQVAISEFKAKCLALIDEMGRTGEPIVITKRGTPVAEVGPPSTNGRPRRRLGGMAGTLTYLTDFDITTPTSVLDDWEWDW